jgi:ATPase subunit of ABC transporter with duplicated ATPase domains
MTHSFVFLVLPLFLISVEALSEALSEWGDDQGALVVVSHDRTFCSERD